MTDTPAEESTTATSELPEVTSGDTSTLPQIKPETAVFATFEAMKRKRIRERDLEVPWTEDDGSQGRRKFHFVAISSTEFDELQAKYPPKDSERLQGATYDEERFIPALLAEVVTQPKLTKEQWGEIYKSPEWSPGEVATLYLAAMSVCQAGLDVSFSAGG